MQIAPDYHGKYMSGVPELPFFRARSMTLGYPCIPIPWDPIPVDARPVRLPPHCSIMAELA
jgi:hypothetical protein